MNEKVIKRFIDANKSEYSKFSEEATKILIDETPKLKRNERAIIIKPAKEYWRQEKIIEINVFRDRFGKIHKSEAYSRGGYENFEEAIFWATFISQYPPNYLVIQRQMEICFDSPGAVKEFEEMKINRKTCRGEK